MWHKTFTGERLVPMVTARQVFSADVKLAFRTEGYGLHPIIQKVDVSVGDGPSYGGRSARAAEGAGGKPSQFRSAEKVIHLVGGTSLIDKVHCPRCERFAINIHGPNRLREIAGME